MVTPVDRVTPGEALEVYSPFARALHWLMAAVILVMIPLGFLLGSLPQGAVQNTAFDLHKSLGVTLLALAVLRIVNRIVDPPPPALPMPRLQALAARAVHLALYVLLVAMPVTGIVGTQAFGAPVPVFWLFDLPLLVEKNEALSSRALGAHEVMGFALAGLLVLHISAALHHHFVVRDATLARMLGRG